MATPAQGFGSLGLRPELLQSVEELGFEEPTPIQRRTIPLLLEGRDVVAQAQTGTGKTAAFALPLLQRLDVDNRGVQAMVLAPTRELAVQVASSIHALGRHLAVQVLPVYGGQPIERQLRALRAGVQVVIGTPGRILDHVRRGTLNLGNVRILVLDEADEMLDMGFEEEIEAIIGDLPESRQTSLFSATIPPRIVSLSRRYLKDAIRVAIEAERLTVPQVQQTYYEVATGAKLEALTRILDMETPGSGIIFCRTKRDVDELGEALMSRGYPVDTLHGDLSQPMRDRVMHRFREGQAELLVATDVAARGLDIEHVSHVINFNIPEDPEQYIHRIGRTARAGRSGDAITLVTPREMRQLHEIERLIRRKIRPARVPTAGDIAARRLEVTKEAITRAMDQGGLGPYLLAVEELAGDGDIARIAAAALRLVLERDGTGSRPTVARLDGEAAMGVEAGMQRLFIDLGRKQGIRPSDIVGAIANEAGVSGQMVGAIDIYDNFTFVDVSQPSVERVISALQGATLHGKAFRVDIARPRDDRSEDGSTHPPQHERPQMARTQAISRPDRLTEGDDARPRQRDHASDSRPSPREQGFTPDSDDEEEDEPPRRPSGWRDGVPPRPTPRYLSETNQQRPPRRPPGAMRGREGFGPFRGPEPREVPPRQRQQGANDRGPFPRRSGEYERSQNPYRSQRGDTAGGYQSQPGDEARRPRRRDISPSDPTRRRPPGGPPQRPPRRRFEE